MDIYRHSFITSRTYRHLILSKLNCSFVDNGNFEDTLVNSCRNDADVFCMRMCTTRKVGLRQFEGTCSTLLFVRDDAVGQNYMYRVSVCLHSCAFVELPLNYVRWQRVNLASRSSSTTRSTCTGEVIAHVCIRCIIPKQSLPLSLIIILR